MQAKHLLFIAALAATAVNAQAQNENVATFEDVTLAADTLLEVTSDSSFTDGGFTFDYAYSYGSASGFRVSGKKDTSFKDWSTPYNSCVGHGYNNSANYAVFYPIYGRNGSITSASAQKINGFYGAVNTYIQHSILNGDSYARKFTTSDWLRVDCIGVKDDNTTDTISYYLVDYRSENEADHYYLSDWTYFDLSKLGEVKSVYFAFDGTDKGAYGLNTPTYLLIDNYNANYDGTSKKAQEADRNIATAIRKVKDARSDIQNDKVYNLAGQIVGNDYKGIVIINGKKVLRK